LKPLVAIVVKKPTYEELEQRITELEDESAKRKHAEEVLRESEERFRHQSIAFLLLP